MPHVSILQGLHSVVLTITFVLGLQLKHVVENVHRCKNCIEKSHMHVLFVPFNDLNFD